MNRSPARGASVARSRRSGRMRPWPSLLFLLALCLSLAPRAEEPEHGEPEAWFITGRRLEGIVGGRSRMDHVEIRHGQLRATALLGIWDPREALAILQGEVRIADTARVITSDSAMYNRRSRILIMDGRVRGRGPEGRMGGEHLYYRRAQGWGRLSAGAWLQDERYRVEADTIIYDDRRNTAWARGRVTLRDLEDSTRAEGDAAFLDRDRDEMVLTSSSGSRPRLIRSSGAGEPPVVVVADTLRTDQVQGRAEAIGDVVVQQGSVGAAAERARFFRGRRRMEMLESPRAWDVDGTVAGDTLRLVLAQGGPQRLLVLGKAQAEYLPDERPGEEMFAIGDTLVAHFADERIERLDVRSGAQSLYIPAVQDREEEGVGLNWAQARYLSVHFNQGRAERVELEGDARGVYIFPRSRADTSAHGPGGAGSPRDSLAAEERDPHALLEARRRLVAARDLREPDSLLALGPFDPLDRVIYRARRITFLITEDRVGMEEGAVVEYQGMTLEADTVQFNSLRESVVALGEPALSDEKSRVTGRRMTYRLDSRKGMILSGRTSFESGFYHGEKIKRVDENTLYAYDAEYTTCDRDSAHYSFWSRAVKIRVKDKAQARPVVLQIARIPILALPYWIFPLRTGRRSGFIVPEVEIGIDRDRGRFLRNVGYYWAVSDYMDFLGWGDYYEVGPRFISNGRFRYKKRYLFSGSVFGSYSREKESDGSRSVRWDLRADHQQTLRENLTLKLRADFVSDAQYRGDRDFGAGADERLDRKLKSNLDLRQRWTWGTLAVTMDRTEYLDETTGSGVKVALAAPSIDFTPTSFTIGRAPDAQGLGGRWPLLASTYLRTGFSFRSVRTDYFDRPTESNSAARQVLSITDARRLGNALNLSPSLQATGAWFAEDARGNPNGAGAVWSAGFSASSTLYGTFFPHLGPLRGIRHVLEPSASYSYQPDFPELQYTDTTGARRNRFPSVGGIALGGSKVSRVSLSLTQRLHIKWLAGEEERKMDNLVLWTTGTTYDFLAREKGRYPWSSLENSIRLSPARFWESRLSFSHDLRRKKRTRVGLQNYLRLSGKGLGGRALPEYGEFGEPGIMGNSDPGQEPAPGSTGGPWSLNLTHTLSQGETRASRRSDLNVAASLDLTPNWRLSYSLYYDLEQSEVKSQGFTLYRDLHCWEARLERRSSGRLSQYYFRVSIKQIPDVKYERQRSGF